MYKSNVSVNMILFTNIDSFLKCLTIYGKILSATHLSAWDGSLTFNIQEEDTIEHTDTKCHVFTLRVNLLTIVCNLGIDHILLLNILKPRY